jgi:hypothetical protein
METETIITNIQTQEIKRIQEEIKFYRYKLENTNDMIECIVLNSYLANLRKELLSCSRN